MTAPSERLKWSPGISAKGGCPRGIAPAGTGAPAGTLGRLPRAGGAELAPNQDRPEIRHVAANAAATWQNIEASKLPEARGRRARGCGGAGAA